VILIYMLRVHPHDYILIYHDSVPFWNREGSAITPTSFICPSSMSHTIHCSGRALLLKVTVHKRNKIFNRHVSIT